VKRVEIAQNEVNIVFRVDPYPGDPDLEKKSLQLCRGSNSTPMECRRERSRTHVLLLRHELWTRHTPRAASRFVGQPCEPFL
jgi:hypothetical protein